MRTCPHVTKKVWWPPGKKNLSQGRCSPGLPFHSDFFKQLLFAGVEHLAGQVGERLPPFPCPEFGPGSQGWNRHPSGWFQGRERGTFGFLPGFVHLFPGQCT